MGRAEGKQILMECTCHGHDEHAAGVTTAGGSDKTVAVELASR